MNTETLLPLAFDLLLKSSGILLLAFALDRLRRVSAAQRCLVWTCAFGLLALLPLSPLIKPRWSLAIEPTVAARTPVVAQPHIDAPVASDILLPALAAAGEMEVPQPKKMPAFSQTPAVAASPQAKLPWSLAEIALAVWSIGAALVLAWRCIGFYGVARLRRQSVVLEDDSVRNLLAHLTVELNIKRQIELRISAQIPVPVTWGVLRPVVLLPREALSWDNAALEAALRHELGHIRHLDALTRWLSTLVCAALWPNALTWLAAAAWRRAQEQACDDLVLRAGMPGQDYALQLLDAARRLKNRAKLSESVMAMAKPSTLETRLVAIMDEAQDRRPLRRQVWLAGGAAMLAGLMACMAWQVRAQDKVAAPDLKGGTRSLVELRTRLLELAPHTTESVLPAAGQARILEDRDLMRLSNRLFLKAGADLLSLPVMITRDGESVRLELTGVADPRKAADLKVQPKVEDDGSITLTVEGSVRGQGGLRPKIPGDTQSKAWSAFPLNRMSLNKVGPEQHAVFAADVAEDGGNRPVLCMISARVVADTENMEVSDQGSMHMDEYGRTKTIKGLEPYPRKKSQEEASWKARTIILPEVVFQDAKLEEVLEFLREQSRQHDPKKRGVNIVLEGEPMKQSRVTLDRRDVLVDEVLQSSAKAVGMLCRYDGTTAKIAYAKQGVKSLLRWNPEIVESQVQIDRWLRAYSETIYLKAEKEAAEMAAQGKQSPLVEKARKQIMPLAKFEGSEVLSVVTFLTTESKALDPEGKGVPVQLRMQPYGTQLPKVSMDLRKAPLDQVLATLVEQGGLKVTYAPERVLLDVAKP